MRICSCDDCGAKIKSLIAANGGTDIGVLSDTGGAVLVVPIYREDGKVIKLRAIDCCIECLKKRGKSEKEQF